MFTTFIAHGSSIPEAVQFMKELIAGIGPPDQVNVGFFDFAAPTIPGAISAHIQNGAKTVRVIPLFLVPGKHLTQDIPLIIHSVREKHPAVEITLEDCLGSRPEFREMIRKIILS